MQLKSGTFIETTEERRCERLKNLLGHFWNLPMMIKISSGVDYSLQNAATDAEESMAMIKIALDPNATFEELGQLYSDPQNRKPLTELDSIDKKIMRLEEKTNAEIKRLRIYQAALPIMAEKGFITKGKGQLKYLCAKDGDECTQYFVPKEYIENQYHPGGALTDGKGGYIYYDGKWATIIKE